MYLSHTSIERIQQYRYYYSAWSEVVKRKNIYKVREAHFLGQLLYAVCNFMLEEISASERQFLENNINRLDLKAVYRNCESLDALVHDIEVYMVENYKENTETDAVLQNLAVINVFLHYLEYGNTKEVQEQMDNLCVSFWNEMRWNDYAK